MRIDRLKKVLVVAAIPSIVAGFWLTNAFSQTEVSTQIVGFVRDVDNDGQVFRFMAIPFTKLGSDGLKIHYLNKDDNHDGVFEGLYPSDSDAIFDTANFTDLDEIYKLDPVAGAYLRYARLYRTKPSGFMGTWSGEGWYEKTGVFWKLSKMYFAEGEGFLVKYKTPPANLPSHGKITNFIGEFTEGSEVITPIQTGYNLVGNPFPVNLHLSEAFVQEPDNSDTLPTAGTGGTNPPGTTPGDKISFYDNNLGAWKTYAVYFNHPTKGLGWYALRTPFWYKITNNPNDTNNYGPTKLKYDDWYLKPGKAYLYYSKTPFFWKAKAPEIN